MVGAGAGAAAINGGNASANAAPTAPMDLMIRIIGIVLTMMLLRMLMIFENRISHDDDGDVGPASVSNETKV